jgi:3-oxoacyl-[acyl-carrier protein] reductase
MPIHALAETQPPAGGSRPNRSPARFDFSGRTLLLTGANGGIGRHVAQIFATSGANLVLADRDIAPLQDFMATLDGSGRRIALELDAGDPASAESAVGAAAAEFGEIDFVVPCAGIYLAEPFSAMTDAQWRRTLSINLDGVFYLLNRVQAHLAPHSAIVNLTSLAAYRGAFSNAHYAASKGALTALTRSLARELGPKTRVNAVAPGIIETPMTRELLETRGESSIAQTPLARLGHPSEVASVVAFLCSDGASFISGETIQVNGALYMA